MSENRCSRSFFLIMSTLSSTLGEWHILGCACLKHKWLPCSGPTTDDLNSRVEFVGGTYSQKSRMKPVSFLQKQPHSNQSEIDGRIVPTAAACPTICIICCQLYHSDYCAAASARTLLHSYATFGSTSLQQTQSYFLNHLSLGHCRGALSIGRRDQTK